MAVIRGSAGLKSATNHLRTLGGKVMQSAGPPPDGLAVTGRALEVRGSRGTTAIPWPSIQLANAKPPEEEVSMAVRIV